MSLWWRGAGPKTFDLPPSCSIRIHTSTKGLVYFFFLGCISDSVFVHVCVHVTDSKEHVMMWGTIPLLFHMGLLRPPQGGILECKTLDKCELQHWRYCHESCSFCCNWWWLMLCVASIDCFQGSGAQRCLLSPFCLSERLGHCVDANRSRVSAWNLCH